MTDQAVPPLLSAEVSWRCEPGVNEAYVWLSDGTIAGHRDLLTGTDHLADPAYSDLLTRVLADWLAREGASCPPAVEPLPWVPEGRGILGWLGRRRARREYARQLTAYRDHRLDHPAWKAPTDPPHAGWRDLVRNEAGQALWEHAATLPKPGLLDAAGRREQRAWTTGALGEETVAKQLWQVARPGAWRVLHSVPVGNRGSDLDHVLVGPGGVFTVNTKSHRGANVWVGPNTFMVNGQRHPYLRNSRHEAARAAKLLEAAVGTPVAVRPMVVLVDPRSVNRAKAPDDVAVVTRMELVRWASRLPTVLTPEQVDAVFAAARRSTTWVTPERRRGR
ncbi:nuclease-related domain-containing protein [Nocardioides zeae]|uniref:Nuclease-related domain-containing protein n=1 Tax=Nocardioides imazamoxiresistens TaxID=3231893 RepID=A0ABU3PY99_9ACTN|nr:nuclease-related domain-containing protein [Nocardioides zeae]MDT9594232.1 nuclease-related domain-containing protein [Nocardioides zeae]